MSTDPPLSDNLATSVCYAEATSCKIHVAAVTHKPSAAAQCDIMTGMMGESNFLHTVHASAALSGDLGTTGGFLPSSL